MNPIHIPGPDAGPRIMTSHDCSGWSAWDDRYGADTSPIGRGDTEAEAINDLRDQIADANDAVEDEGDHRYHMMKEG